jgi:hypothetical protein
LPHYYNVLAAFHVTDIWSEKIQGCAVWKGRLEKIDLDEKSWWAIKGSPKLTHDPSIRTQSQRCSSCTTTSKTIFNAGWACLDPECASYFVFANEFDEGSLDYCDAFLKERSPYQGPAPRPLAPALLTSEDMNEMDATGSELAFKQGIVCPQCGCCSRRIAWTHWKCENVKGGCNFEYRLAHRPIDILDLPAHNAAIALASKEPSNILKGSRAASHIANFPFKLGGWSIDKYPIPDQNGRIIGSILHLKASPELNRLKDGADDLFHQMQTQELNLRRVPARQQGCEYSILPLINF